MAMKKKIVNTMLSCVFASTWLAMQPSLAAYGDKCDNDAQCDDGLFCNGAEQCFQQQCMNGSQPLPGRPLPGTSRSLRWRCDESQDRYVVEGADLDGDGHDAINAGGDDCDDNNANRFPGNVERCDTNGVDEDCDPTTVGFKDEDGDGYNSSSCFNVQPDGTRRYDRSRH
ncbi:MAG TPA: hypothetical protein ENI97_15505 [Gammaproteobacteria bacterium]|nr:hypothetical protein [Gammaproteobacteria bacterium]